MPITLTPDQTGPFIAKIDGINYNFVINPTSGLALPRGIQGANSVQSGTQAQASKTLETPTETPDFGLTLQEKQSIETDIKAQKPIGVGESAPAYKKLLASCLSEEVSLDPFLGTYKESLTIIDALKMLFPDKKDSLRLANKTEAIASLAKDKHFTGFRDAGSGEVGSTAGYGFAWFCGTLQDGRAPYICRNHDGYSNHYCYNPQNGLSMIPVFG